MTPEDEWHAAKANLAKARAAYGSAESELIRAEREMVRASRSWELYRLSNDYIKRLDPSALTSHKDTSHG